MSSNEINLHEIFSQFKQYRWSFEINCNPTALTCVATSEEEARRTILDFITKIDNLTKEFRIAKENKDWEKMRQYTKSFNYDEIRAIANLNIGRFCTLIHEFHLGLQIDDFKGEDLTLGEFINNTKPSVKPFNPITVYSCLSG
jgi:hypothetical protein